MKIFFPSNSNEFHVTFDDLCCKQTRKVSLTYCKCTKYVSLIQVRVNLYCYTFSFPFAVWKSNSLRFKMSKQKIWSDFNRLECGKTEKIFAGTWSFNKRVEISSSVERMVLQGGSKLEENETNDADTFIIHYTAVCLHFRLDRLFYA